MGIVRRRIIHDVSTCGRNAGKPILNRAVAPPRREHGLDIVKVGTPHEHSLITTISQIQSRQYRCGSQGRAVVEHILIAILYYLGTLLDRNVIYEHGIILWKEFSQSRICVVDLLANLELKLILANRTFNLFT